MPASNTAYRSNIFQQVKEIPIQEVLERYGVELRPVGNGRMACHCIFHDDRHPSLVIYPDGFHCFVCGAHGDAVSFVSRWLNIRPIAAAQEIASCFNLPVDQAYDRQDLKEQIRIATNRIEAERALRDWADSAYLRLMVLRRACFLVLDRPNLQINMLIDVCDMILDELQFGDKQAVRDAAISGELGLPGTITQGG
jgi:hypothetical protein